MVGEFHMFAESKWNASDSKQPCVSCGKSCLNAGHVLLHLQADHRWDCIQVWKQHSHWLCWFFNATDNLKSSLERWINWAHKFELESETSEFYFFNAYNADKDHTWTFYFLINLCESAWVGFFSAFGRKVELLFDTHLY